MGIMVGVKTGKEALREKQKFYHSVAHCYWNIIKILHSCYYVTYKATTAEMHDDMGSISLICFPDINEMM